MTRNYKPRKCECASCVEPNPNPVVFTPTTGPQRVAPQCRSAHQIRKSQVDKEWAARQKKDPKARRNPKRPAAHIDRTPIKRCRVCAGLSERRPKLPLPPCTGCGFWYAKEKF